MFWEVKDNGFEFNCSEGEAAQVSKIEEMFSEGKASTIGEDCYIVACKFHAESYTCTAF